MATRYKVNDVDYIFVDTGAGGSGFVPDTRQVIAGVGLNGGGALVADVTLNVTNPLPAPPAYNAQLVSRASVATWQQAELVQATFNGSSSQVAVTWPTFAARPFYILVGAAIDADEMVTFTTLNTTATGCTLQASGPFTGTVTVQVLEVI